MAAGVGFRHFLAAIFATIALVCSLSANVWCESIQFTSSSGVKVNFGVFSRWGLNYVGTTNDGEYVIKEECINYENISFDSTWKTVKAFAIIAPIFGGVLLFWTCLAPCFYRGVGFWRKAGIVYLLVCIFQGLTLLFLQSDACKNNPVINGVEESAGVDLMFPDECERDWGYNTNIASVVLWFMTAVCCFVIKPSVRPDPGPPATQTVTYTQSTQPDGTTAVTTAVVKGTYVPEEGGGAKEGVEQAEP